MFDLTRIYACEQKMQRWPRKLIYFEMCSVHLSKNQRASLPIIICILIVSFSSFGFSQESCGLTPPADEMLSCSAGTPGLRPHEESPADVPSCPVISEEIHPADLNKDGTVSTEEFIEFAADAHEKVISQVGISIASNDRVVFSAQKLEGSGPIELTARNFDEMTSGADVWSHVFLHAPVPRDSRSAHSARHLHNHFCDIYKQRLDTYLLQKGRFYANICKLRGTYKHAGSVCKVLHPIVRSLP